LPRIAGLCMSDQDSADCSVCGKEMARWSSSRWPIFILKGLGLEVPPTLTLSARWPRTLESTFTQRRNMPEVLDLDPPEGPNPRRETGPPSEGSIHREGALGHFLPRKRRPGGGTMFYYHSQSNSCGTVFCTMNFNWCVEFQQHKSLLPATRQICRASSHRGCSYSPTVGKTTTAI
jgi:hypothetical protein